MSLHSEMVVKQEPASRASLVSNTPTVTSAVKTQDVVDDEDESLFGMFQSCDCFRSPYRCLLKACNASIYPLIAWLVPSG